MTNDKQPMTNREAPWHAGLRAARAHLVPGLVLQACAITLVIAYYKHAPTHAALDALAAFRERTGWLYGIVATGLFGGVLPLIYLKLDPATRSRFTLAQGAVLVAFWSYKGFEVDLWYRGLNFIVGSGHGVGTIVTKMLLDQFVYCPLYAVPAEMLFYAWCEAHFDAAPARVTGTHGAPCPCSSAISEFGCLRYAPSTRCPCPCNCHSSTSCFASSRSCSPTWSKTERKRRLERPTSNIQRPTSKYKHRPK